MDFSMINSMKDKIRFNMLSVPNQQSDFDGWFKGSCDMSHFCRVLSVLFLCSLSEIPVLIRQTGQDFFDSIEMETAGGDMEQEENDMKICLLWLFDFCRQKRYPRNKKYSRMLSDRTTSGEEITVSGYMKTCMGFLKEVLCLTLEEIAGIMPCIGEYMASGPLSLDSLGRENFVYLYTFSSRKLGQFLKWKQETPYVNTPQIEQLSICAEVLKYPFCPKSFERFDSVLTGSGNYTAAYTSCSIWDSCMNPTYLDAQDEFSRLYEDFERGYLI